MMLWEKIAGDPELTFEVTTIVDDHLAYARYYRHLPERRRQQLDELVGYGIMLPLIAGVACLALLFALQGTSCDLEEALGVGARARIFAIVLAGLVGGHALIWLAVWLRRRTTHPAALRASLARRPGINPTDPRLAERNLVAIHASGFRFTTEGFGYASAWTTTRHFDEVAEHFFIVAETYVGFALPKRDMTPAIILTLRDTMLAFRQAKRR